ncbi:MAG: Hint domain-containing protein, partial [Roseobacter sp.]|nr:Hint domain-containing protein [Roseobacter sp.]
MARLGLWTFEDKPGSKVAADSETGDGAAQDGFFKNGATTTGSGAGIFDGRNDYVEIPHDPEFDLKTGSISISFTQETASSSDNPWGHKAAQTLFSRDSSGFDGGGHLTIFIKSDGSIGVRHQDSKSSYDFEGGDVTLGKPSTVIYSWGPKGSQLSVDGVIVDSGSDALYFAGNSEPITIGASQAQSGNNTANNLKGHFDGKIDEVAIYDTPMQGGSVPCLTRGTLIRTPSGDVPIESLNVGDLVCTMHHGAQQIRWIGSRRVELGADASTDNRLRP